jgi:hypothetical protein
MDISWEFFPQMDGHSVVLFLIFWELGSCFTESVVGSNYGYAWAYIAYLCPKTSQLLIK